MDFTQYYWDNPDADMDFSVQSISPCILLYPFQNTSLTYCKVDTMIHEIHRAFQGNNCFVFPLTHTLLDKDNTDCIELDVTVCLYMTFSKSRVAGRAAATCQGSSNLSGQQQLVKASYLFSLSIYLWDVF